jgi:hypothetical protein
MREMDNETLERAEREAMQRPGPCGIWDDRLYNTHAPVIGWAERGDDLMEESNYLTVLAHLQGIAVHDDGDAQPEGNDYVIDATMGHWLVGSLRQVFVRVRDDAGEFTQVWVEAVGTVTFLREDYPLFDESDYSEREWARFEENLEDALIYAAREFVWDDNDDVTEIRERVYTQMHDGNLDLFVGGDDPLDESAAEEAYLVARQAHFEGLARNYLPYIEAAYQPTDGQSPLI